MAVNVKYQRHGKIYTEARHHQSLQTSDKGENLTRIQSRRMSHTDMKENESRFLIGCNASETTVRLPL